MNDSKGYARFQANVYMITGYVQDDEGQSPIPQEVIVAHNQEVAMHFYRQRHPGMNEVSISQWPMAEIYILATELQSLERRLIEQKVEEVKALAKAAGA